MYIRELQLDGYGALQALKLQLETPVTVIYGPNEAGKSTVLRFIRSLLYGFPTRKDLVERGEPVFGGRHGGRMRIEDARGQEFILERYADKGSGLLLRDGNGQERLLAQAEWERLMLGGISERLFRQLFAVSLNELHELRALQGQEVGNYIYHAGLAGGAALTAARRQIHAEMDRLFRPRGTTHEMNRILAELKEIEVSIRQSRDDIQAYNEARAGRAEAELQLASLEQSLPQVRLQVTKLIAAHELRDWWLKREIIRMEEAELRRSLPSGELPLLAEECAVTWGEVKASRAEAVEQQQQARHQVMELQTLRESLTWEDELVFHYPEWERLESLREGMIARRDEVVELEAEHRMLDDTVQSILSRLSADWGEAELLAYGGMAAEREWVRRLQQSMEQAERASITLQADVRRLNRQQEVVQAEASTTARRDQNQSHSHSHSHSHSGEAGEFVPRDTAPATFLFKPRTRDHLLQAWHQVEDARRGYDRIRTRMQPVTVRANRSNQTRMKADSSSRMTYFLAGIVGFTAIVIMGIMIQAELNEPLLYSLAALLFLLSLGLVLVAGRARKAKSTVLDLPFSQQDAEGLSSVNLNANRKLLIDKLSLLMNDTETAAAKLLPDNAASRLDDPEQSSYSDYEDSHWTQLREAVHEQLERYEAAERGRNKQLELEGRIQELQLERELLERDRLQQQEQLDQLNAQWKQWLSVRKLPAHLSPEALPELLGLAEQGQSTLRQRQRVKDRLDLIQRMLEEFEQSAAPLIERCSPPAAIRKDVIQAVQWLYREASKQQLVKDEAGRLEQQLLGAEASLIGAQTKLTACEEQVQRLLSELHIATEGELEQRLRIDDRCHALRREAREIELRLEAGRDAQAREQLYELLEMNDEATLVELLQEQKIVLAAVETQRTELLERKGRLSQELDRLRTESELTDKRIRLSELQNKLEQLSERYAILALSDQLIVQTKAVFEEEKQPEVLQRASDYMRQMTNGAYTRIIAPSEGHALLAETKDQRLVDSSYLSRGTQEQLLLAMRFALCNAASADNPLPLLLDDLFVHFDEGRLAHTLPVLESLASTRQVVLFTCHARVAQTIKAGIPSTRLLSLPSREA